MKSTIEVGQLFEGELTKCPVCGKSAGFSSLDSHETYACCYCGSRFLSVLSGVEYVGDWESYTLKDRYNLPPKGEEGNDVIND